MKTGKLAVLALLTAGLLAGITPAHALPTPAPGAPSAPVDSPPPGDPGLTLPGVGTPAPAAPAPGAPSSTAVSPQPAPEAPAGTAPATAPAGTAPATGPGEQPTGEPTAEADDSAENDSDEDKDYDPVGAGFPVPGPNTPLVTEPDGTVRSAVETDITAADALPNPTPAGAQGLPSALAAPTRSGNVKVTLVIATLADNRGKVDVQAAKNSIYASNSYWRAMSNNRLSFSIAETLTHTSKGNSNQDYAALMNTISRELGWTDGPYEALVVYVPAADLKSGGYGGILGGGWTSNGTGGRVLMPAPSSFSDNVVTHEFGHVLGLLHANSLTCSNGRADVAMGAGGWSDNACYSREYGDTTDLMGYAQYSLPTINSYFWDEGGFGRGNEILNAGTPFSSKTYTLKPWAGSEANRALKFRDTSGETYYLELRLPVGYDAATATGGNRGVKITKADRANSWAVNSLSISPNTRGFAGYSNPNSAWQAGQTFTTYGGTRVTINSVGGSSASVTITGGAAAQALAPIDAARKAHPELGNATSEAVGNLRDGGVYRNYQNGSILWSPATGAKVSPNGAIRNAYRDTGYENGGLGYPTSDEQSLPGGGKYQNFQGGAIIWTAATGARVSAGDIRRAWQQTGFEKGPLGYPTSNEVSTRNGGTYQNYQKGTIYWSPATGARVSPDGPIRNAYKDAGSENGSLGFPTSDVVSMADGGKYQNFQGGAIIWSSKTGARVSSGDIRAAWQRSGFERGALGYPTSNEMPTRTGGRYQNYQKGAILWSPATGARLSPSGPIRNAYSATGFENGGLGYPTSDEQSLPGGGKYQNFQGGAIIWTAATGARVSAGDIRRAWQQTGFEKGPLGYPTSNEVSTRNGGTYQNYQKGTIYWSRSTGAQVSPNGAIRDAYRGAGYENGGLGYPTGGETALADGGRYQNFQGGAIIWSTKTGARVSAGDIRKAWEKTGFERGTLGYPTSNEVSTRNGGTYQNYQKGTIYWSKNTGAQLSPNGVIRDAYKKAKYENGELGYPTTGTVAIKGGSYQNFENGAILWSQATGAQVSLNGPIRTAYQKAGFETGRLGFPTSGIYNVTGGKAQNFQGGKITLTGNSAKVTYK